MRPEADQVASFVDAVRDGATRDIGAPAPTRHQMLIALAAALRQDRSLGSEPAFPDALSALAATCGDMAGAEGLGDRHGDANPMSDPIQRHIEAIRGALLSPDAYRQACDAVFADRDLSADDEKAVVRGVTRVAPSRLSNRAKRKDELRRWRVRELQLRQKFEGDLVG